MTNKRNDQRTSLVDFQQVLNVESGKVLGYLGDVSHEGLRVLSRKSIPIGETFRLGLKYVRAGGVTEELEIDAESVWERSDAELPYGETGFHFAELSAEALERIDVIIEDLRKRAD